MAGAATGAVTIVAILKDEAPYLPEWLAFHRAVGVSDFLLYDHGSSDGSRRILRRGARAGLLRWVEFHDRTSGYPQGNAYNEALLSARIATPWAAFVDLDEFLLPMRHERLDLLLAGLPEEASALLPNWAVFGSDGRGEEPPQPVLQRFHRRLPLDHVSSRMTKVVLRTSQAAHLEVHAALLHGGRVLDGSGDSLRRDPLKPRLMTAAHAGALLRINHYLTKSPGEWRRKIARGAPQTPSAPGRPVIVRRWSDFEEINACASEEDRAIDRFLPQVAAELRRLEALLEGPEQPALAGNGEPLAVPDDLEARLWQFHRGPYAALKRMDALAGDALAAIAAARPYIAA